MARVDKQSAFVLHSRPYRESSLLLDLFTQEYGVIPVIARSARGPKSRFRGILQAFVPLQVAWSGRGELVYLSQAELSGLPLHFTARTLISALYLNELLCLALHRYESHEALFEYYQQTITQLYTTEDIEPILRCFEWRLLQEVGYAFDLSRESHSHQAIQTNDYYAFETMLGLRNVSPEKAASLHVFSGADLMAFAQFDFSRQETRRAAKRLMRLALQPILQGRRLNSRELFGSANNEKVGR